MSKSASQIILFLAALGFIVSLLASVLAGVGIGSVLLRTLLSALFMAAVGAGLSFLITKKLPEIDQALSGTDMPVDYNSFSDEKYGAGSDNSSSAYSSPAAAASSPAEQSFEPTDYLSQRSSSAAGSGVSLPKARAKAREGEILVEGIPIQNEPGVMADAIRQLLDQDEEAQK